MGTVPYPPRGPALCAVLATVAERKSVWRWVGDFPQHRLYPFRYAALVGVVACIAVVVLLSPAASYGNVPGWISAVGAVFTAAGFLLAARTYREARNRELEDQANHARLLLPDWTIVPLTRLDGTRQWTVTIENRGEKAVHDVRIQSFKRRHPTVDSPLVKLRAVPWDTRYDDPAVYVFADDKARPNVRRRLDPGQKFLTRWTARKDAEPVDDPDTPMLYYTVMDSNGRSWLLADYFEPEKFHRNKRPREQRGKVL